MRPAVFAFVMVGLCSPQEAIAQGGADDKTASEASRAFAKASRLFKERKFVNAVAAFELAYRLRPHFMVQCSIARCYQNMNDMLKAAEHYQRCLDEGGKDTAMAKRVRASLKSVKAQITWVDVQSPGRGGTIYVDGKAQGEAPRKIGINPGTHVIEVRRSGAKTASSTIKTLGGEERELVLIPLDLKPTGEEVPDKPTPSGEEPPARRGLSQVWFWTGVGVTAALAIVTTVMGVQTLNARTEYNDNPTQEGADTFDQRRLLTNVFLGLTVAAAGGTTVLYFFTDFRGKEEQRGGDEQAMTLGVGLRGYF
jgi:hypothetical protein